MGEHASASSLPPGDGAEEIPYQPPHLLARYDRATFIGGGLFVLIFAGWLVLQWSVLPMRLLAAALLLSTLYVVVATYRKDVNRRRGRSLALRGRTLVIHTPAALATVDLPAVAAAVWSDDAGLRFVDGDDQTLSSIDLNLIATQDEARRLLAWLRHAAGVAFPVRWPQPA